MPKVSIIVPVYNVERSLFQCLDSLAEQSFEDFEVLLVDDGSTDRSGAMCDLYAARDPRIKVIHKQNGGLSSARLAGFQLANGEYLAFVDSDDWIAHDMLEKTARKLDASRADICMFGYFTVSESGNEEHQINVEEMNNPEQIMKGILIPMAGEDPYMDDRYVPGFVCTKLYRRDLVDESFFVSEREYFAEDVVFNLQAFSKANKVVSIAEGLYFYCSNPDSLTNVYRDRIWEKLNCLYHYMNDFYASHGWLVAVQSRLDDSLLRFLIFSTDNECKKGNSTSLSGKRNNLLRMMNSPAVLERNNALRSLRTSPLHGIYRFLIKYKMVLPLIAVATLKLRRRRL